MNKGLISDEGEVSGASSVGRRSKSMTLRDSDDVARMSKNHRPNSCVSQIRLCESETELILIYVSS